MRSGSATGSCEYFFFQAEDGIRDADVTGVQTCALPICEVANELGYEVLGTYTSVIAPINGIDEKTIRFFAEVHYQNNDDLSFLMRNEVMAKIGRASCRERV